MGIAAYNRGSRAIGEIIRQDFAPGRFASDARTVAANAAQAIARLSTRIEKLERLQKATAAGKTANFRSYCKLMSDFKGYRQHSAKIIRHLTDANTEKERQRAKLARCVREHLTPDQWLAWSENYRTNMEEL